MNKTATNIRNSFTSFFASKKQIKFALCVGKPCGLLNVKNEALVGSDALVAPFNCYPNCSSVHNYLLREGVTANVNVAHDNID